MWEACVTGKSRDSAVQLGVAKAALVTGGSFATAIGSILGAAGLWALGDRTVLYALVALCVIAAMTMFTAAAMARR
jgi:hypothetical protein